MDNSDKNIDWEKLLILRDEEQTGRDDLHLSQEELDQLRIADEMKLRLKEDDLKARFPVEEGWERFRKASGPKLRPVHYLRAAAAILVLLATAGGAWLFNRSVNQQPEKTFAQKTAASGKAEIRLANGKVMVLGDSVQNVNLREVNIQASKNAVVYNVSNTVNSPAGMDTLVVPRGIKMAIQLADGSKVTMNSESSLVFPAVFEGDNRTVALTGEAFFEIEKKENKPFIVQYKGIKVTVLGTAFNVNTYDKTVYTTLVNGKVKVTAGNKSTVLEPGEQHTYDMENDKTTVEQVDTDYYTGWKNGFFYFDHESLSSITHTLARSFDYDFKFNTKELEELRFTLEIPHPVSLAVILDQLSKTSGNVVFTIKGRIVYIDKK